MSETHKVSLTTAEHLVDLAAALLGTDHARELLALLVLAQAALIAKTSPNPDAAEVSGRMVGPALRDAITAVREAYLRDVQPGGTA